MNNEAYTLVEMVKKYKQETFVWSQSRIKFAESVLNSIEAYIEIQSAIPEQLRSVLFSAVAEQVWEMIANAQDLIQVIKVSALTENQKAFLVSCLIETEALPGLPDAYDDLFSVLGLELSQELFDSLSYQDKNIIITRGVSIEVLFIRANRLESRSRSEEFLSLANQVNRSAHALIEQIKSNSPTPDESVIRQIQVKSQEIRAQSPSFWRSSTMSPSSLYDFAVFLRTFEEQYNGDIVDDVVDDDASKHTQDTLSGLST